jgi:hypothetical protein
VHRLTVVGEVQILSLLLELALRQISEVGEAVHELSESADDFVTL